MFIYNKIIEGTDTGICAAACRRLGKHKYAVNALLRCEDIKPVKNIGHLLFVRIVKRNTDARRCGVK